MDVPFGFDSHKGKEMLKIPQPFASTGVMEDSGYLSQELCSPTNQTHSINWCSSDTGSPYPSESLCSSAPDMGIFAPLKSIEMENGLSLGSSLSEPQSKSIIKPTCSLQEVYQSTPTSETQCLNVHKEFAFVTPLPGPSQISSSKSFSLVGQHSVDILSHLSQQRILPALHKILNYLEPADLCRLRLVSSSWRKLLNNFPQLKVWQQFVSVRRENKENSLMNCTKPDEHQDLLVTPVLTRGQLREINNFILVPTRQSNHSPPVSPSKMHSSRYFKEGQKLKSGEKLRKCPKCAWPSRADNSKLGVRCTGRLCGFYFCMDCSGPFHENTPCATAPVTPTKAKNRVHKLSHKRRLHRLLL